MNHLISRIDTALKRVRVAVCKVYPGHDPQDIYDGHGNVVGQVCRNCCAELAALEEVRA